MVRLSFLIVGSGYRSEYYVRTALTHPDLFSAMVLCRSEEKAQHMRSLGVSAVTQEADALAFHPDAVLIAVDRDHVASCAMHWASLGFPVITETPVGAGMDDLNALWNMHLQGARIVCCEQYIRHPILQSGLQAVRQGLIGKPQSAYLSLVHDYHGASVLRHLLDTGGEGYVMQGIAMTAPMLESDSRYGAIYSGTEKDQTRRMLLIRYDSGKTAIYDFCPVQYRTYLYSRHLTLRGSRGEWTDRVLLHPGADGDFARTHLMPSIPEKYRCLDTQSLRELRKTWTSELFLDTLWDEYAIGTFLLDMRDYLDGGPEPYPLWEALDDAAFWLLSEKTGEHPVTAGRMPWTPA